MSNDVTIVHCFAIFHLFGQFLCHLLCQLELLRGFAFQIREYSSSYWTKIQTGTF